MNKSQKFEERWIFNYLAVIWLLTAVIFGSYIGYRDVIPIVYGDWPMWAFFNRLVMVYGLVVMFTNWLLLRFTNAVVPLAKNSGPLEQRQKRKFS